MVSYSVSKELTETQVIKLRLSSQSQIVIAIICIYGFASLTEKLPVLKVFCFDLFSTELSPSVESINRHISKYTLVNIPAASTV